jgi:hypothetical protein
MGGAVTQLHFERIVPMMKIGLRVADAVAIDAHSDLMFGTDNLTRAVNLAKDIRSLPDWVSMLNGTRWNGIPIALLLDDDEIADYVAADPSLRSMIVCSTRRFSVSYYEYTDPWIQIYDRLDDAAYQNAMERVDQMQSVGHRVEVRDGRWLRMLPPPLRTRNGTLAEIETQLYNGRADQLIRRSRRDDDWDGRDVLLIEREGVSGDLDGFEHLVGHAHNESEMQHFYGQRPYMLGAGAFETTAHPQFWPLETKRPTPPDFVQHSCNDAIVPKPGRVVEIKTPKTRLLTKTGLDWHFASRAVAGLAQARRYSTHAKEPKYRAQMEAIFGEAPRRVEKMLIVGTAANHGREELDRVREYDQDVLVRGFDEMLDTALSRFASESGPNAAV